MELTKIYRKTAELTIELFQIEKALKKMKCDSETELKIKNLILEGLRYGTNSLLISVDIMNEAIETKDDATAMETVIQKNSAILWI